MSIDSKLRHMETDLLVVGSGAAGMTTALVASIEGLVPLVVEKTECFGGSTAISGGGLWSPNNHLIEREGRTVAVRAGRGVMLAAGNTAASVMGNTYVGGGATLGPAMTFAYLAAMHALPRGEEAYATQEKEKVT